MIKRFILDPSFWLLLTINLYCIHYYQDNPNVFKTIVWLYWGQSVLIGLFNFAFLLTLKNAVSPIQIKSVDGKTNQQSPRKTASLFLLHYGAFHFGYMIFLFAKINKGVIDLPFLLLGLAGFSITAIIDFIHKKMREKFIPVNISTAFFLPYLRIIPMHLMFLLPAFTGWKISSTFLILKTIADMAMYIVTNLIEQQNKKSQA